MNEDEMASLSEETNRELEKTAFTLKPQDIKPELLKRDFLAEDFFEKADNVYASIIVMSHRARQIGAQQARIIGQFLQARIKPDAEENEDEAEERQVVEEDDEDAPRLPRFEKPTVLAMNEMFKGNLKYKAKE